MVGESSCTEPVEAARGTARPSRAAKRRAIERFTKIHEWENCAENSESFIAVARHIEEELENEKMHESDACFETDDESSTSEESDASYESSFIDDQPMDSEDDLVTSDTAEESDGSRDGASDHEVEVPATDDTTAAELGDEAGSVGNASPADEKAPSPKATRDSAQ